MEVWRHYYCKCGAFLFNNGDLFDVILNQNSKILVPNLDYCRNWKLGFNFETILCVKCESKLGILHRCKATKSLKFHSKRILIGSVKIFYNENGEIEYKMNYSTERSKILTKSNLENRFVWETNNINVVHKSCEIRNQLTTNINSIVLTHVFCSARYENHWIRICIAGSRTTFMAEFFQRSVMGI